MSHEPTHGGGWVTGSAEQLAAQTGITLGAGATQNGQPLNTGGINSDKDRFGIPAAWYGLQLLVRRTPPPVTVMGDPRQRVGGMEEEQRGGPRQVGENPVYESLGEFLKGYWTGQHDVGALQTALFYGGFYSGRKPPSGMADDRGFAALSKAVILANKRDMTLEEVLREAVAANAQDIKDSLAGPDRAPLVVHLANPADIAKMAEAAAREVYGGSAPPEVIQRIVARYQTEQRRAQESAYAQDPTGGTVTQAPDLSVFVQEQLEGADPTRATAHRVADDFAGALQEMLAGPFGG